MKDLKNTISTICAFVIAICGAILGLATTIVLPTWAVTICTIFLAVATAVIGVLTGRNSDGSKKQNPTVV
jgi:VIT1/CCC1 family predicted Fe2+/Mn2+ transporter